VAIERIALTLSGHVHHQLKTPYPDGTTHRDGASRQTTMAADAAKPPTPSHVAMGWAHGLQRVFGIEIEVCARCGGKLALISSIEGPIVSGTARAHHLEYGFPHG